MDGVIIITDLVLQKYGHCSECLTDRSPYSLVYVLSRAFEFVLRVVKSR